MMSMDRALQRNAQPYKRSMMSMDRALQRNAQPYKRSMWSMDRALQRNTHPYKRSMWSMDRSLIRNVHPYKRAMDYPEDRRALLEFLKGYMDNSVEKRSAPSYDELLDYLNALEDIKEENSDA